MSDGLARVLVSLLSFCAVAIFTALIIRTAVHIVTDVKGELMAIGVVLLIIRFMFRRSY